MHKKYTGFYVPRRGHIQARKLPAPQRKRGAVRPKPAPANRSKCEEGSDLAVYKTRSF